MPEIIKLVPMVEALEYDGTNGDECGSFYAQAQRVTMTGHEDELWIRFGPQLGNGIVGPFAIGTVFLRTSSTQQQYQTTSISALGNSYLAVLPDGTLSEEIGDTMS